MEVRHLGHAGFVVSQGSFRLGIDPWFYPAFLESWFPWPDNRELTGAASDVDALYISHAHEDHFDRRHLAGWRRLGYAGAPVIIPAFRSRYLEREARRLGFTNVITLGHGQQHAIGGLTLTMLIDRSHKEDSALLVQDPARFRFLDANDCELAASDWPGSIDLLACQYSGAFWYPHCYDFTQAARAEKAAAVREASLARLLRRLQSTGARAYLPSAGPAVFLDPALHHYNDRGGIYPSFSEVLPALAQGLDERGLDVELHPSLQEPVTAGAIAAYRGRRLAEWAAFGDRDGTPASAREVDAHFTRLQRRSRRLLGGYARDITVSSDGQSWRVPLGLLRDQLEEAPEPHYALDVPPVVLRAILNGDASWETALLSNRVGLHRDPDVYDTTLMELLAFGDRPVQTLAIARHRESAEMVTRDDGLAHQRWCPHAGEDLASVPVDGGVITCPRHGWQWDAKTGRCLTPGGLPLAVEGAGQPPAQ